MEVQNIIDVDKLAEEMFRLQSIPDDPESDTVIQIIYKTFDEIKTDMSEPIGVKPIEQFQEPELKQAQAQEQIPVYKNHVPDTTPKISLTKRESNSQINEANQQYRAMISSENQVIPGANTGSRFMDVTSFNQNSYMLL